MSTQERPRDKKSKPKEDSLDDWLDNFDSDTKKEQKQPQPEQKTSEKSEVDTSPPVVEVSDVELLIAEFSRKLPGWIGKPWMYVKPSHDGHFKNWIESWKKLILDYTETLTKHIVSVYDLQTVHPFTNKDVNKDLSIPEIQEIVARMVDDNLAKWLDDDNNRARIYFKTDEQWATELYKFMLDQGYATDIMTLYEMKNLEQPWSSLPESELGLILDILIKQEKAQWIGQDRDTIQFKV